MNAHHPPSRQHVALIRIVLVAVALALAGPAAALDPFDEMPPGWDDQADSWYNPWGAATGADNTYLMHASREAQFILYSWFMAAFGRCCDSNLSEAEYDACMSGIDPCAGTQGWRGDYYDATGPFDNPFPTPGCADSLAGLFCHNGWFRFDYDINDILYWDHVSYNHFTEGKKPNGTPWEYSEDLVAPKPDQLIWNDSLSGGTPIIYLRDAAETTMGDNEGYIFFWPSVSITNNPWRDGMYLLPQSYHCTYDDPNDIYPPEDCYKDIFVYENSAFMGPYGAPMGYGITAYYAVIDGVDSNWSWDGETEPDTTPWNDFNIKLLPRNGDFAAAFLILSDEPGNYCACDIERRWYLDDDWEDPGYDPGEDPPPEGQPGECDDDPDLFDDHTDYPEGFLSSMDICDDVLAGVSNLSMINNDWDPNGNTNIIPGNAFTQNSSIAVKAAYCENQVCNADPTFEACSIHARYGDRMLVMSSGDTGGAGGFGCGSSILDPEWYGKDWGTVDLQYIDYSLPPMLRCDTADPCCPRDDPARYDVSVIEFDLEIPSDPPIYGLQYDMLFLTSEFPEYVGTPFNDGFEAIVETVRATEWEGNEYFNGYVCDADSDGVPEGNTALDSFGNAMRANNAFVEEYSCEWFDSVPAHQGARLVEHELTPMTLAQDWDCCGVDTWEEHSWDDLNFEPDSNTVFHQGAPWSTPPAPVGPGAVGNWWGEGGPMPLEDYICGSSNSRWTSGSTRWITNAVPVAPGETVHIKFVIFDAGDLDAEDPDPANPTTLTPHGHLFDTFIALDNFRFTEWDPVIPHIFRPPEETFFDPLIDGDGDGYSAADGDCNDGNPNVHPGAAEDVTDCEDTDCDGFLDPSEIVDADGDGTMACEDCDDTDISLNALDLDSDGYSTCDTPADCDDTNNAVSPGVYEASTEGNCTDGLNNDCDAFDNDTDKECSLPYCIDDDGDGWGGDPGTLPLCPNPDPSDLDCDDNDPTVNPGATEIVDTRDNDCDGWALLAAVWDFMPLGNVGPDYWFQPAVTLPEYDQTYWYSGTNHAFTQAWPAGECNDGAADGCFTLSSAVYDPPQNSVLDLVFLLDMDMPGAPGVVCDATGTFAVAWEQRHDFENSTKEQTGGLVFYSTDFTTDPTDPFAFDAINNPLVQAATPLDNYGGGVLDTGGSSNPYAGWPAYVGDNLAWTPAWYTFPVGAIDAVDPEILWGFKYAAYKNPGPYGWSIDDLTIMVADTNGDSMVCPD